MTLELSLRCRHLLSALSGAASLIGCAGEPPPAVEPNIDHGPGYALSDRALRKRLVIDGVDERLATAIGRDVSKPPDRTGALAGYASLCQEGMPLACALLTLVDRTRPERNEASQRKAFDPLETACAADVPAGCHLLGLALDDDGGLPVDQAAALAAFVRGCELGFLASCPRASLVFIQGPRALEKDARKLHDAHRARACAAGLPSGCRSDTKLGYKGDDARACQLGDVLTCTRLLTDPRGAAGAKRQLDLLTDVLSRICDKSAHPEVCAALPALRRR